jgi:hypothetical protein
MRPYLLQVKTMTSKEVEAAQVKEPQEIVETMEPSVVQCQVCTK